MEEKPLELLRKQINELDINIISLFEERLAICKNIGKEKKKLHLPIENKVREKKIIEKLKNLNVSKQTIELFKTIFILCKEVQHELK